MSVDCIAAHMSRWMHQARNTRKFGKRHEVFQSEQKSSAEINQMCILSNHSLYSPSFKMKLWKTPNWNSQFSQPLEGERTWPGQPTLSENVWLRRDWCLRNYIQEWETFKSPRIRTVHRIVRLTIIVMTIIGRSETHTIKTPRSGYYSRCYGLTLRGYHWLFTPGVVSNFGDR